MKSVDILFDAPPGPVGGKVIGIHNSETDKPVFDGSTNLEKIDFGEWIPRDDGLCALRIPLNQNLIQGVVSESFIENPMDRDRLAIKALCALIQKEHRLIQDNKVSQFAFHTSTLAYAIADAMIAESRA